MSIAYNHGLLSLGLMPNNLSLKWELTITEVIHNENLEPTKQVPNNQNYPVSIYIGEFDTGWNRT